MKGFKLIFLREIIIKYSIYYEVYVEFLLQNLIPRHEGLRFKRVHQSLEVSKVNEVKQRRDSKKFQECGNGLFLKFAYML